MLNKTILLIGGTHGNETTGIKLVEYLLKQPIFGIESIIANPKAVNKRIRYIDYDLNRIVGNTKTKSYEQKILKILKSKIFAAGNVLEFHNTTARNNTCAIITIKPNSFHLSMAKHFGLKNLLIMPPGGSLSSLNSPNFFSLEISNSDRKLTNIDYLVSRLKTLKQHKQIPKDKVKIFSYHKKVVSKMDIKKLGLRLTDLRNFRKFSITQKQQLNLPEDNDFCPIFIGEKAYGKDFGFQIAKIC